MHQASVEQIESSQLSPHANSASTDFVELQSHDESLADNTGKGSKVCIWSMILSLLMLMLNL